MSTEAGGTAHSTREMDAASDAREGNPWAPPAPEAPRPSGKELDLAALYEEHFAFVWRTARRLGVPERSLEDAAQDVFLVVHARLASFEGRSSVRTWLFGIVRRVARDHRALKRSHVDAEEGACEALPSPEGGPDERAARAESARVLHELLDGLEDDKREAFVLAELEQLTMPEVAEALGLNLNTAYSRVRAARRELDEALARLRARDAWRGA